MPHLLVFTLILRIPVGVLSLPVPAVAHHLINAVLGFPAQFFLSLGRIAKAGCDVACTAWFDGVGDRHTVFLLECLHHVKDAVAMACAEVVDAQTTLALNGFEGADMPVGKVYNMDLVAHARAVGGGVVVAKYTQLGSFAHSHLRDVGH